VSSRVSKGFVFIGGTIRADPRSRHSVWGHFCPHRRS
jgi:hypothetical protein